MTFRAYRRPDGALVLVPELFDLPLSVRAEGRLSPIGSVDVDLDSLSPELVERITRNFYGVAHGADGRAIDAALAAAKPQAPASA